VPSTNVEFLYCHVQSCACDWYLPVLTGAYQVTRSCPGVQDSRCGDTDQCCLNTQICVVQITISPDNHHGWLSGQARMSLRPSNAVWQLLVISIYWDLEWVKHIQIVHLVWMACAMLTMCQCAVWDRMSWHVPHQQTRDKPQVGIQIGPGSHSGLRTTISGMQHWQSSHQWLAADQGALEQQCRSLRAALAANAASSF
jgi:hypothetical protein